MMDVESTDVVDRIYEAAINDEVWTEALDGSARLTSAASAEIIVYERPDAQPLWSATDFTKETLQRWIADGAWRDCVMSKAAAQGGLSPGFLTTEDIVSPEEWRADPTAPYFDAIGLYHQLFSPLPLPTGETVFFSFERKRADGRFAPDAAARLDALLPHLSRAALVSARLHMQRTQAATEALRAVGVPAAVMSRSGRVRAANELFAQRGDVFLEVAFGGLAIADPRANALFQRALVEQSAATPIPRSIPVAAQPGRGGVVVHVLPLRRSAREILGQGDVLVAATFVGERRGAIDAGILRALFDLTPAEARFAAALANGGSVAKCARGLGVTEKTGRTYLDRIYAKTGRRRQAELISLLRDIGPT